jgi:hypothetical protein
LAGVLRITGISCVPRCPELLSSRAGTWYKAGLATGSPAGFAASSLPGIDIGTKNRRSKN